jgi:prepilin-type N-terminal cleavage/methylation domain-containing protein
MNYLNNKVNQSKNEQGFTLIELLIVIVILGILAAVVVFSVGGITDRGAVSACKSTREQVTTAGEAYKAKNGTYPATWSDITTGTNVFINAGASSVSGTTTAIIQDKATGPNWAVTAVFAGPGAAPAITGLAGTTAC